MTKPSASLNETGFFSVAATNGWAGCSHNAELVGRTVALRNLKLLVGSGGLDFDTWHGFLRQTCRTNLFLAVRHI